MRRTRASYLPFFLFPVNLTLLCPLSLIQYTDGPHWQVNSWLNFPASLLTSNVSPVVLTTATPGSTCSLASYAPYCAWEWTKTTSERMAFPVRPFQSRRATPGTDLDLFRCPMSPSRYNVSLSPLIAFRRPTRRKCHGCNEKEHPLVTIMVSRSSLRDKKGPIFQRVQHHSLRFLQSSYLLPS